MGVFQVPRTGWSSPMAIGFKTLTRKAEMTSALEPTLALKYLLDKAPASRWLNYTLCGLALMLSTAQTVLSAITGSILLTVLSAGGAVVAVWCASRAFESHYYPHWLHTVVHRLSQGGEQRFTSPEAVELMEEAATLLAERYGAIREANYIMDMRNIALLVDDERDIDMVAQATERSYRHMNG